MTREELHEAIEGVIHDFYHDEHYDLIDATANVLTLVDQYVSEVIGEEEEEGGRPEPAYNYIGKQKVRTGSFVVPKPDYEEIRARNQLRAEQRKRAGITNEQEDEGGELTNGF